jgi:putative PIN family toxin of toxin-antitoxin system
MLKVVLDTNVIVSGLNFPGSKPAKILELVAEGEIINLVTVDLIHEVIRVLTGKFLWSEPEVEAAKFWLRAFSKVLSPAIRFAVIAHEPDNRVLECAVAGQAHYIISGDRHLTDLTKFQKVKIVSPAEFLELLTKLN